MNVGRILMAVCVSLILHACVSECLSACECA